VVGTVIIVVIVAPSVVPVPIAVTIIVVVAIAAPTRALRIFIVIVVVAPATITITTGARAIATAVTIVIIAPLSRSIADSEPCQTRAGLVNHASAPAATAPVGRALIRVSAPRFGPLSVVHDLLGTKSTETGRGESGQATHAAAAAAVATL